MNILSVDHYSSFEFYDDLYKHPEMIDLPHCGIGNSDISTIAISLAYNDRLISLIRPK